MCHNLSQAGCSFAVWNQAESRRRKRPTSAEAKKPHEKEPPKTDERWEQPTKSDAATAAPDSRTIPNRATASCRPAWDAATMSRPKRPSAARRATRNSTPRRKNSPARWKWPTNGSDRKKARTRRTE